MQACVAGQGAEALLGCQVKQKRSKLDVVGLGQDLGAELYSLSASRGKPLQRLPRGRRYASLIAGYGGLGGDRAPGEIALREAGAAS